MAPSSSSSSAGLFPSGASPEQRNSATPSAICSFGMRPHIITGFLRQLYGQHFADPNNLENPILRRKIERLGPWVQESDDGESPKAGIQIESVTRWKPDTMQQRPAIVIKRNDWKWVSQIIDDRAMGDRTPDQFEHYVGWWRGSHTVFAIAGEGGEAEHLGTEIAKLMVWYRSVIRRALNLDRWVLVSVGSLVELEEADENYAVPVTVSYAGQESWELLQEVPRLKRISIKASNVLNC